MEWGTLFVLKQHFPDASAGVGVYASRGFIQDDNFGTANKCNGNGELPLHATWKAKLLSSATGSGWCHFFPQRYSSLSLLIVDHPSTLGSYVQELVDWLWSKCVEMYLSILYCLLHVVKWLIAWWEGSRGWRELRTDAPRSKSPPSGVVPRAPLM